MAKGKQHTEIRDTIENRDRIHIVMLSLTMVFIVLSVGIVLCIIRIQTRYSVDPKVINIFRPRADKYVEVPERGRILAEDGRPLAITTPLYDIFMDCTVRKAEFEEIDRKEDRRRKRLQQEGKEVPAAQNKGAKAEKAWQEKALALSRELAKVFPGKSADQYYKEILAGRKGGRKHMLIQRNVNHATLNTISEFPLFEEGPYRGGLIAEEHEPRPFPAILIGVARTVGSLGLRKRFFGCRVTVRTPRAELLHEVTRHQAVIHNQYGSRVARHGLRAGPQKRIGQLRLPARRARAQMHERTIKARYILVNELGRYGNVSINACHYPPACKLGVVIRVRATPLCISLLTSEQKRTQIIGKATMPAPENYLVA